MADDKPRCEWVRDDIAAATNAMLREMKASADNHAHERRVTRGNDTIYLMVERMPWGELRGRAVSGLPEGKVLEVDGRDIDELRFEARHALIEIYNQVRLPGDTSRDVRERVHATTIEVIDETP